jgi:hypothetical protein
MSDVSANSAAVYCVACANKLVPTAAFCPKCGTPRAHLPNQGVNLGDGKKSKTTAVLLAVFLSYWTWLYSYKNDAIKFYLALSYNVGIVVANLLIVRELIHIYIGDYNPSPLADQVNWILFQVVPNDPTWSIYFPATYFASFVIWLLAIISAARKPSRF